jgi:hypothetical protein
MPSPITMQDHEAMSIGKTANNATKVSVMLNRVMKLLMVNIRVFSFWVDVDSLYMCMPNESAMLSATAMTSKDPIMLALGLPDVRSPKIIPRLVTVEDVAPKLNLLGSLGNFTSRSSHQSFSRIRQVCIFSEIFNFHSKPEKKNSLCFDNLQNAKQQRPLALEFEWEEKRKVKSAPGHSCFWKV